MQRQRSKRQRTGSAEATPESGSADYTAESSGLLRPDDSDEERRDKSYTPEVGWSLVGH